MSAEIVVDLAEERMPGQGPTYGQNQLFGLNALIEEHFTADSRICEVGSYLGVSTRLFLARCGEVVSVDQCSTPELARLAAATSRLRCVTLPSVEAARAFPGDCYFDGVYLDADHHYRSVVDDILSWYGKLAPGGVLCGHDYVTNEMSWQPGFDWFGPAMGMGGVRKAVDEIFAGCEVRHYADTSWAVRMTDEVRRNVDRFADRFVCET